MGGAHTMEHELAEASSGRRRAKRSGRLARTGSPAAALVPPSHLEQRDLRVPVLGMTRRGRLGRELQPPERPACRGGRRFGAYRLTSGAELSDVGPCVDGPASWVRRLDVQGGQVDSARATRQAAAPRAVDTSAALNVTKAPLLHPTQGGSPHATGQ